MSMPLANVTLLDLDPDSMFYGRHITVNIPRQAIEEDFPNNWNEKHKVRLISINN